MEEGKEVDLSKMPPPPSEFSGTKKKQDFFFTLSYFDFDFMKRRLLVFFQDLVFYLCSFRGIFTRR